MYTKIIKMNSYPIDSVIKIDIIEIPSPLPDTRKISTSSRFRLKYWPTISAAGSLAIPTPNPKKNIRENEGNIFLLTKPFIQ